MCTAVFAIWQTTRLLLIRYSFLDYIVSAYYPNVWTLLLPGKNLGRVAVVFISLLGVEIHHATHTTHFPIAVHDEDENAQALYDRGWELMQQGSPAADQSGLSLMVRAAEKGNSLAACELAAYYRWLHPDDAKLARWMAVCAEARPTADREEVMGRLYLEGRGLPVSVSDAVRWYQRAADRGNEEALWALFYIYRDGHATIQPDRDLALRYAIRLMKHIQTNEQAKQFILIWADAGRPNAVAWVCQPKNRPNVQTWLSSERLSAICEENS